MPYMREDPEPNISHVSVSQEIVEECNVLALSFCEKMGHRPLGESPFKMYLSTHPTEILLWEMAVEAYLHIEGTDVLAEMSVSTRKSSGCEGDS